MKAKGTKLNVFPWSTVGHTCKPFINPYQYGYNGLLHSPNALQQFHFDTTYIYNHTLMDELYMYVYVHYGICVYTQIVMLWIYLCTMGI